MTLLLNALQACSALELINVIEPAEHKLRIVVSEAAPDDNSGLLSRPAPQSHGPSPIGPSGAPLVFELSWSSYIGYTVLNECYVSADRYETFEGQLLVEYSRAHYMDYIAAATFANTEYPGPIRHWGLFCLDHVINIASVDAPVIRRLDRV
ncbi:hypothetical protein [Chitinimonas naiadis]